MPVHRADSLDLLLKNISVAEGVILDSRSVVVYRIYGVSQQRGDTRGVGDTESYQSKNTKLRIEPLSLLGFDAHLRLKQAVELLNKVGVELQKGVVEHLIEVL